MRMIRRCNCSRPRGLREARVGRLGSFVSFVVAVVVDGVGPFCGCRVSSIASRGGEGMIPAQDLAKLQKGFDMLQLATPSHGTCYCFSISVQSVPTSCNPHQNRSAARPTHNNSGAL